MPLVRPIFYGGNMNFFTKLFSPAVAGTARPVQAPVMRSIELVPNAKYRLTRQMFLFPAQAVSPEVNDYLRIGATVTYVKSGELTDFNNVLSPWVYVRSEKQKKKGKGTEGWCFSHYLERVE
jgi:hypothetical protein